MEFFPCQIARTIVRMKKPGVFHDNFNVRQKRNWRQIAKFALNAKIQKSTYSVIGSNDGNQIVSKVLHNLCWHVILSDEHESWVAHDVRTHQETRQNRT